MSCKTEGSYENRSYQSQGGSRGPGYGTDSTCFRGGPDLTLDEALADPVIGAALKADGLAIRDFETTLRAAARRIGADRRPAALPAAALAARALRRAAGDRLAW